VDSETASRMVAIEHSLTSGPLTRFQFRDSETLSGVVADEAWVDEHSPLMLTRLQNNPWSGCRWARADELFPWRFWRSRNSLQSGCRLVQSDACHLLILDLGIFKPDVDWLLKHLLNPATTCTHVYTCSLFDSSRSFQVQGCGKHASPIWSHPLFPEAHSSSMSLFQDTVSSHLYTCSISLNLVTLSSLQ